MARATLSELEGYLAANPQTRHIDGIVFDSNGIPFGKRVPLDDAKKLFTDGIRLSPANLVYDGRGQGRAVGGIGVTDGDPDAAAYPVSGTLVPVPWIESGGAQVLLGLEDGDRGGPLWFDPRAILIGVLDKFAALGLTPVVACEYEFYLIDKRGEADEMVPARTPRTGAERLADGCLWIEKMDDFSDVLTAIEDGCRAQGLPVGATTAEYSSTQFEINLNHKPDALRAADDALMMRRAVRGIARAKGMDATFMAKPFLNGAGSGLHVHVSVADKEGNIFDERRVEGTEKLHSAVAGLQATASDMMLAFAPNLNSYRRYQPGVFAPMKPDWAEDDRRVSFRIPRQGGAGRRVEHRIAGADANPYLVLAGILSGILDGIERRLVPTSPGPRDDGAPPPRLWTALPAFRGSFFAERVFGPFRDIWADLREIEAEAVLEGAHPQEQAWYG